MQFSYYIRIFIKQSLWGLIFLKSGLHGFHPQSEHFLIGIQNRVEQEKTETNRALISGSLV